MKTSYKIKLYQLPFTQESDNRYTDIAKIESYKLTDWIKATDNNGSGDNVRKYWNWFLDNQIGNIYRKTIKINIDLIPAARTFNFVVIDFGDYENIYNLNKIGFWNIGNEQLVSENQLSYELEIDVVFSYGKDFLAQIEGKQVKVNSAHLNVLIKNNDKLKSIIFDKNIQNNLELQAVLNGKEFQGDNYIKNDNKTKMYDPLKFIIKLKNDNIIINKNLYNETDWKNMWQFKWREFFLDIYGRNLPWQDSNFTKDYDGITNELDLYNLWFDKNWKWLCFLYTFFYIQTGNQDNDGYSSNIAVLLNDSKVSFHSVHKDNFSSRNPNVFSLMTQQSYNNIIKYVEASYLKKEKNTQYYILKTNKSDNYTDGNWEDVWNKNKYKWNNNLFEENDYQKIKKIDNNTFEIITKQIIFGGTLLRNGQDLNERNTELIWNKNYKYDNGIFYSSSFLWSPDQVQLDVNNDETRQVSKTRAYKTPRTCGGFPQRCSGGEWRTETYTTTEKLYGRFYSYISKLFFHGIWENFYKTTIKRDGTKRTILTKQVYRKANENGRISTLRNINWDMVSKADHIVPNSFNQYENIFNKKSLNIAENQVIYYREPVYNSNTKSVSYKQGEILSNILEPHIENLDKIIENWFNKHKYSSLSSNLGFQKTEIIKSYFTEHSNFFLDISDGKMNDVAYWIINNVKKPTLSAINNTLGSVEGIEPKLNNILERLVMRHKRDFKFDCFYLRQKTGDRNIYILNSFGKIKYQNLEYNLSGLDETKIYNDNKAKKLDDILNTAYALEIYTPELLNYQFNEIVMRNGDKFLVNNYDVINDMTTIFFQNTISGQLWLFDNQLRRIQNKLVNSLEVPIVENQLTIQKRHFQKELDVENSKLDLEDKKLDLSRKREVSGEYYNKVRSGINVATSAAGFIGSLFSGNLLGAIGSFAGLTNSSVSLSQTLENEKLSKRAHSMNLESRSLARQDYQNQLTRKSFALESTGISDAQSVMKDEFRSPLALEHKELGLFDKKKIADYHHLFGTNLNYIDIFYKNKYLNRLLFNYLSITGIETTFTNIPTPFIKMIKTSFASGVRLWEVNFDKQKLNWQKDLD